MEGNIYNLIVYQVQLGLAKNRNKIPLPKSIASSGIPLPPELDTLISPNYQLLIPKEQRRRKKKAAIPTHPKNQRQICHNKPLKGYRFHSLNVGIEPFDVLAIGDYPH
ncbi:hypothetical protein QYF36_001600 [Acer negundo]|nr:hypothetical protein QYF36_001600 [Acer negundo]